MMLREDRGGAGADERVFEVCRIWLRFLASVCCKAIVGRQDVDQLQFG